MSQKIFIKTADLQTFHGNIRVFGEKKWQCFKNDIMVLLGRSFSFDDIPKRPRFNSEAKNLTYIAKLLTYRYDQNWKWLRLPKESVFNHKAYLDRTAMGH